MMRQANRFLPALVLTERLDRGSVEIADWWNVEFFAEEFSPQSRYIAP